MAEEYATSASQQTSNTLTRDGNFIPASGKQGNTEAEDSPLPNPLHDYASYNYNFSLKVLTDDEFNSASYRGGTSGPWLARSASMTPEDRVEAFAGKFEYFIEDVSIKHLTGFDQNTGNTNAIGFSFKVIEPYSMGLFFQAVQTDASRKGHTNYLDAPMLLMLEFKGHQDYFNQLENVPNTTKYFPLKLRLIEMSVTQQGSVYDINAYPVNEYAFEQAKVTFNTSVSAVGKKVEDMLKTHPEKSVEVYLNKRAKEHQKDKVVTVPDQYEIQFPDTPLGPNTIKNASLGFDLYNAGATPFGKDNLTYENGIYKRGNLSINPKDAEFKFAQDTDIINAINQVVLMSEYGRDALKPENITSDGFIKWWRVETEMKYITTDANLSKTGTKPKKFIYRVIPYMADSSLFLPPNERRKGTEADKRQVAKVYNYIYSGKNIDILDFNITFKTGFYKALHADANKRNQGVLINRNMSPGESPQDHYEWGAELQRQDGQSSVKNDFPTQANFNKVKTKTSAQGGSGKDDHAVLAARAFHDAITTNTDMVSVDLTILGDPYYIGDSGMGNYHAGVKSKYVNSDDAMTWDITEVHIILNFRTPADIDMNTGLYDFNSLYDSKQFSGLYRVITGESFFVRGKFTQKLRILRLPTQDSPAGTGKTIQDGDQDYVVGDYGVEGQGANF